MHIDEVTTTSLPLVSTQKLDQTTSRGVIVTEELPTTTEFPESSTHQISSESTSTLVTNEDTTSAFTETTTFTEQGITTDFLPKFSTEINTESPSTKTSIDISTSDGGTTTEFSPKTTFTVEQTTYNDLRFSKGMKFTEESSMVTEIMKDSTAETDVETSTSIQSESTQAVAKRVTIPVVEETTVAKEEGTTSGFTTESSLRITVTNVTGATSTAILSSFQNSSDAMQKHEQSTENLAINLTTLRLNTLYVTEVPGSSGTTNEPITSDDNGHSSELEGGSGTIVAIVISCVGGVCLVALACLLVVMRNRQKRFNYGQRCKPVSMDQYSVDSVSVFSSVRRKGVIRHSKRSYGNPAFEDPVCLSHPLNFPAISKFAANTEDVEAEFNDIPQIVARTSELPEGCETKNRFANVIPLPESRVFLTPMAGYPNSDYINANYVTGPKNTRKYYIACQAPMSNTVDDFWRMIWEQQCKVILMLTHLFENGAERCFDYLPPSEVLDCHRLFGDYQVTLKKREVKEKYIISSLQLKNMVSNSWREVTHFWYMGWPEKGVPVESNSIIAFLIEARSYMKSATIDKVVLKPDVNGTCSPEINPVVVHCSPGTGRTGTAITCDIAIREFEQTRQVDIPKIVYRIRRDRANAVQTKEQYAFIYKVIALYATKLAGGSLESI
ncbi:hypothetical protein WA026_011500 [Henosepilachna vigintioctopunctata]|uniref:Uncharacterized protein n=1 Tax=Henosepilachna vigintioctopunctata TaxID=420089 RepID=A0AAW1TJP2_9CUCU